MPSGVYDRTKSRPNSGFFKKGVRLKLKEDAGYRARHYWVESYLGKADHCSFDSSHKSTRFNWANVSGVYLRDVDDWTQLCAKCHKEYDIIRRGYTANGRYGIILVYQDYERES